MTAFTDSTGRRVVLGMEIARGGEGGIHEVPTSPWMVAKVWNEPSPAKVEKLTVLLRQSSGPPRRAGGRIALAWPERALQDETGQVVGFLMPRAPDGYHQLVQYCSRAARSELEAERGRAYTRPELLNIARNVAEAFQWVHGQHCLVGDVNHTNILVDRDTGSVFLIDVDSFQVTDERTGVTHRCDVGKDEFTPPHLLNRQLGGVDRTPDDDGFGLAVLLFEILMDGVHPYDAVNTSGRGPAGNQRLRNISQGQAPYAAILENYGDAWLEASRVGDRRSRQLVQEMAFDFIRRVSGTGSGTAVESRIRACLHLEPGLQRLFRAAFPNEGPGDSVPHRPTPTDWIIALEAEMGTVQSRMRLWKWPGTISAPRLLGALATVIIIVCVIGTIVAGADAAWSYFNGVVGPDVITSSTPRVAPVSAPAAALPAVAPSRTQAPPKPMQPDPPATPLPALPAHAAHKTPVTALVVVPAANHVGIAHSLDSPIGNRRATGTLGVNGVPQVGETLSVSISDILDEDGLTGASFYYQWLVNDGSSDRLIPGANSSSYTIRPDDTARTLQMTVGFTDDRGNAEFLFSDKTGPVPGSRIDDRAIATVTLFEDAPGELEVAWAQPPETPRDYRINWARTDQDYPTWQDPDGNAFSVSPAYTITGLEPGHSYRVRVRARYEDGPGEWSDQFESFLAAELTGQPAGVILPIPIRTGDSEKIPIIATGMADSTLPDSSPTLTGELRDAPLAHNGVDAFTFRASFSEPIAIGYKTFRDHSFDVTGGSVTRARRVNRRSDLWEITVKPSAATAVSVALASDRACDERGAICTKDGRPLTDGPLELIVAGPDG